MPCTKNRSSSNFLLQARLPQPFTIFLLIPLPMPLIPHPTSCEVVFCGPIPHLISNQQTMLVTSFCREQDEISSIEFWTSMSVTFKKKFFFFFAYFPLLLFQSEGWSAEEWAEWQFTNSHHHHGRLWEATGRAGRLGGLKQMRRCQEGVWKPSKRVAETHFLFCLGLPKWPALGRDPITACFSRELLTVGSFQMGRPPEGRVEQGKQHRLQPQSSAPDCHACYMCDP